MPAADSKFPIVQTANWKEGTWLGMDDAALLISWAEENLVLVGFDRATLAWHAGELLRAGRDAAGVILFRGSVRSTDYGRQARILTEFWSEEGKVGTGEEESCICQSALD